MRPFSVSRSAVSSTNINCATCGRKTLRGQLGQKARGFFVGEATFGYRSGSVGVVRKDSQGRLRPEGYVMRIDPVEADIVRRIFRDFADGGSLSGIVRALNDECVPGRYRSVGGWSPSTVSRILDNTKYKGVWIWNKTRNIRDPRTGRIHSVQKPESEWDVREDESLRIVDQALWEAVRRRREEVRGTLPGGPGQRGFSAAQQPGVQAFPRHLLSGAMVCGSCGSSVCLVSGKGSGYYGCHAAAKSACGNRVLVPRRLAEDIILRSVLERLLDPEALRRVLRRVEEEARHLYAEIPLRRETNPERPGSFSRPAAAFGRAGSTTANRPPLERPSSQAAVELVDPGLPVSAKSSATEPGS